jgi:MFS family permease
MTVVETHERTRRRLIWTLFAGNAMIATGYIGVVTVSTLVVKQITGSTGLAGIPGTLGTVGVAAGAATLSALSLRIGRRPTFAAGYAGAALGAVFVALSIVFGSFPLLLIGMFVIGVGRSVGQLARYAAGDLRNADHRARAISLIVWASTIGAVAGPLLIGPTSDLASARGFDELLGPTFIGIAGFALGSLITFIGLRPEPMTLVITGRDEKSDDTADPLSLLARIPTVRLALTSMMTSQFVMALIMVMTPLFIRANGGSLATVGWVMMAHALGMFAIAPLTGWLVDRYGARKIIALAVVTLVTSGLIARAANTAQIPILLVGLFLLGVGWNFGFVAGSTLLQEDLVIANRLKVQGFADSMTWMGGAVAAGLSGLIVAGSSYETLAALGALLAFVPLVPLYRARAT